MSTIPRPALKLVRANLHPLFREHVCAGDWAGALILVSSEHRIGLAIALLPVIPVDERPAVLGGAISDGDLPMIWRTPLCRALRSLTAKAFDEGGRAAFDGLPDELTIYRGTCEAEGTTYGVSWTLSREKAEWFATVHGRFRNIDSPPVILETTICKSDIAGYLVDRNEQEVLVHPNDLGDVRRLKVGGAA